MKRIQLIITTLIAVFTFASCEQEHHFPALNETTEKERDMFKDTSLPAENNIKIKNLIKNFNLNKNYIDIVRYEVIKNGQIKTSKTFSFDQKPVQTEIENFSFSVKCSSYKDFKQNEKFKIKLTLMIFSETSEKYKTLDCKTYQK